MTENGTNGKLRLYMSMSLDGFIAGPEDGPGRGLGVAGEPLHASVTAASTPARTGPVASAQTPGSSTR